jgi:hypothetical protein
MQGDKVNCDSEFDGNSSALLYICNTIRGISKYRHPSLATVLQRALLYTYITTCFG